MRAVVAIQSLQENPYFAEKIKGIVEEVDYLPSRPDYDELQQLLPEYDVVIIGARERITRAMLQGVSLRTRIVGTLSVGTDHLDLPALTEAGIHVERCPTANVRSVAEHALGMILALSKHLKWGDRLAAEGRPRTDLPSLPFEVSGKTLGLIGYGNIGRALGSLASSIGIQVIATSRTHQTGSDGSIRFETFKNVLQQSNLLSVSVPLTPETVGFLNVDTLSDVRRGAILVNTSRADVLVESALLQALDSGRIAAYGGDYDHASRDLVERPNVLVTPHMAGLTVESNDRLDNELIDRLVAYLGG